MIYSYGIAPVGYHKDFSPSTLSRQRQAVPCLATSRRSKPLPEPFALLGSTEFTARESCYASRTRDARSPYLFLSLPYFLLKIPRPSKVPSLRALDEGTKVASVLSRSF